ncbi:uncharacterized protein LOC124314716 [Daphnia pulicaria]|uniref:uncharacterized protein LOC124314716 n=1 Tax=Daphnia pulicaria TaxID=35523 RepID=UPI001EEA6971|nr:uncharacterized protein LOC124314716 [Daphnia pulicaria]
MSRFNNENEERPRIVSGDIRFTGLNTYLRHDDRFQRMTIAYSMPETVQSEIDQLESANNFSEDEKQQIIEEMLLNETNCHGYFFEQMPSMCYRELCLEMYDENLDTFIRSEAIQNDFQWTLLQDLCIQLVDSITWLHQNNIYYDGRLHPRNIFVKKTLLDGRTATIKLVVPRKINAFNNLDKFYSSFWSITRFTPNHQDQEVDTQQYRIKRDMSSLVFLIYFIQSAGYHLFQVFEKRQDEAEHPDWPENKNEDTYITLIGNIESRRNDVRGLEQPCFCAGLLENPDAACENEMTCKQRSWINSLAKDWINCILGELVKGETVYYTTSSFTLKKHPFFWKVREILNFIERSSNYLKESGVPSDALLDSLETTLIDLKIFYPNIVEYLHEADPKFNKKKALHIQDFRTLLYQIRNKSSHWNEHRSTFKQDAIAELKAIKFVAPPDNEMNIFPDKYCLFWMCNFPTLLLETWNNLKDLVNH